LRRDLFRRGQFCLVNAGRTRTSRLAEAIANAGDPWIGTDAPATAGGGERVSAPACAETAAEPGERLSGVVLGLRDHKRILFADLATAGAVRQIAIAKNGNAESGPERLRVGDNLSVRGAVQTSQSGEPTLFVEQVESLRRRPSPSPGPPSRRPLAHAAVLGRLRAQLGKLGFLEQSTPTLSTTYEGGTARPYATWINQRARPAYLRVTSELNLIKSLGQGLTRCYEIGSSFRNESHAGSSTGHDEFLLAEAYATDMTLEQMTGLTVELAGRCAFGDSWDGAVITLSFGEAVESVAGVEVDDEEGVRAVLARHVGSYAATRPFSDALQILLDEILAPAFEGIAVFTHPPLPSSPLTAGEGSEAARRWVYVEGIDCAEVARNEHDIEVLARDLASQHAQDPFCVPRDYTEFLRGIAVLPRPAVGMGMGVSRLIDIRDGVKAPSHVL
jgi:lysyl-tRNA synthetase class II